MFVVVNHLHLETEPGPDAIHALEGEVGEAAGRVEGFESAHLVCVDRTHYLIVVFGLSAEAVTQVGVEIGRPFIDKYFGPHLSADPERFVGEVVASV